MSELRLISDYKYNDTYRLSFNKLAQEVFGIDFEPWYERRGWNDNYICYSYVNGNRVVANVSINKMDLTWEGQAKRALQIGTVMTHSDYRGRGLALSLINTVLTEHEQNFDFVYLFGDANALGFYRKLGFSETGESQFTLPVASSLTKQATIYKLDTGDSTDLALIERLTTKRMPVSQTLGVVNDQHLLRFYCLLGLSAHLYYLAERDAIVIYRIKDDVLHLYDVISQEEVSLESVLEQIVTPRIRLVRFHFTPELRGKEIVCEPLQTEDALFVRPALTWVTKPFTFPYTSHA